MLDGVDYYIASVLFLLGDAQKVSARSDFSLKYHVVALYLQPTT